MTRSETTIHMAAFQMPFRRIDSTHENSRKNFTMKDNRPISEQVADLEGSMPKVLSPPLKKPVFSKPSAATPSNLYQNIKRLRSAAGNVGN